jgi:hypothetical protein
LKTIRRRPGRSVDGKKTPGAAHKLKHEKVMMLDHRVEFENAPAEPCAGRYLHLNPPLQIRDGFPANADAIAAELAAERAAAPRHLARFKLGLA